MKISAVLHFLRNLILAAVLLLMLAIPFYSLFAGMFFTVLFENILGVPVYIQTVRLDPINTQILLENVRFENPANFPQSPLARVSKIFIDFEIASLWEKRIHFETLEIEAKEVHIMRSADSQFNWFFLKPFRSGEKTGRRYDTPWLSQIGKWPVRIDNFILALGQATYADFSSAVPLRRSFDLRVSPRLYGDLRAVKEVLQIIAWETLIGISTPEFEGNLKLLAGKIESKLGSKRDFIQRWRLDLEETVIQGETPQGAAPETEAPKS